MKTIFCVKENFKAHEIQFAMHHSIYICIYNTVGINPRLRTSRDQGLKYWTGGTGTKIAEKLNNFEKFQRKKSQISALFLIQRPSDDWPDA